MGRSPHTARELVELAALCRRSAQTCDRQEIQEKMRAAALDLEARARKIAEQDHAEGDPGHGPFAHVDLLI